MSGFDNEVLHAVNVDFRGVQPVVPQVVLDGQLLIGATASPFIRSNRLASSDASITITNGPGTIDLKAGPSVVETLSDDVGTVITPSANNIQLQGHVVEQGSTKFSTVVAGSHLAKINPMSASRWIVDPLGFNGTHTTIASAITSATAGDTIFVMPGTYTENLALKSGVAICAYNTDGMQANTKIIGKATLASGTVAISGIFLRTNTDYILDGSGSANVRYINCFIDMPNFSGFNWSSAGQLILNYCTGSSSIAGAALLTMSAGSTVINDCRIISNGGSTAISIASGSSSLYINNSYLWFAFETADSALLDLFNSYLLAQNVIALAVNSVGQNLVSGCYFQGGTASAISVGAGATASVSNSVISSSNTNAIDGAGTLRYSALSFNGTSKKINTTTQTGGLLPGGVTQAPSAGFLGEQISSKVAAASAVSLTSSGTATNVTSISLTAGIWDVTGLIVYNSGTMATYTAFESSISTTSATGGTNGDNMISFGAVTAGVEDSGFSIPPYRLTLTATTTTYLVATAAYGVGTAKAYGKISATRVA